MKTYRKSLVFNEISNGKVKELQEKLGFNTETAVIIYCINQTHNKEFNYVHVLKNRGSLSPEEKEKLRLEQADRARGAKIEKNIERGRMICSVLQGTEQDIQGNPHCEYVTYSEVGGKQVNTSISRVPFENMTEDLIHTQYQDIMGNKGIIAKERIVSLIESNEQKND